MEPRLITPGRGIAMPGAQLGFDQERVRTTVARYVPAPWDGQNNSGVTPVGQRVLVLPDIAEERTLGGIELPPEVVSRHALAAETGVLAACGDGAFAWFGDRIHRWEGRRPHVGDRVALERYAGEVRMGADGQLYRLMEDRAVGGILEQEQRIVRSSVEVEDSTHG